MMTDRIAVHTPSSFAQFKVLLGKDVRREFRTKEMLTSMGMYAVLVLVVYGAALSQMQNNADILQMSGGLLWALIIFTSLLGLHRSFAHEVENGSLDALLLVPMDRSVIFLAKTVSNILFLLIVECIAIPLYFFFFLTGSPVADCWPYMVLPIIVGTVGMAGVGTLLSTMTIHTRGRDVMLAVLFIPLVFPLVYACVSATTIVLVGGQWQQIFQTSLVLGCGYDVVMLLIGWALYGAVVSA